MVYCLECPVVFQPLTGDSARQAFDQYRNGDYWDRQSRVSGFVEEMLLAWRLQSTEARLREIEAILGRPLSPDERVLDVGCGPGEVLHLARMHRSCMVVGVELAWRESFLALSQHRIDVVNADAMRLPFYACFDVIFALHVIEHVHDPVACVKQLISALAPGGRLIIECPNLYMPSGGMPIRRFFERAHLWTFSLKSLERVITEAGGKVVSSSNNGFLRMLVGSGVDASATSDVALGGVVPPVSEQVGVAGGATDAWAVLERYQSSYLRSPQRVRWWWSRAVLSRLVVSAVTRRLSVAFPWGWSSEGA